MALPATAVDVVIKYKDGSGQPTGQLTYQADNLSVDGNSGITLNGVLGAPSDAIVCGSGTSEVDGECVAEQINVADYCGANTAVQNGKCIGIGGSNSSSSSSSVASSSSSSSSSTSGGGGSCNSDYSVITSGTPAPMASIGTSTAAPSLRMPPGDSIYSKSFTTGSDPQSSGTIAFFGTSSTAEHTRRIWISECAGGTPVAPNNRCLREGRDVGLDWALREVKFYGSILRCPMEPNTKYYLNIQTHPNETRCKDPLGCYAYMRHTISGGNW